MMPPEGPNKSEELLQRYATERRAQGGDFALHPATRRLLQGEVARQPGRAGRNAAGGSGWLGAWWTRLALGAAAAVVVGVVMVQSGLFRAAHVPPVQLAKSEDFSVAKDSSELALLREEPSPSPLAKKMEDSAERLVRKAGVAGEKQKAVEVDRLVVSASLQPVASAVVSPSAPAGASIATASDKFSYFAPVWGTFSGPTGAPPLDVGFLGGEAEMRVRVLAGRGGNSPTPADVGAASQESKSDFLLADADRQKQPARPPLPAAPLMVNRAESLSLGAAVASDLRAAPGDDSAIRFYRTPALATPVTSASALVANGTMASASDLSRTDQNQVATRFRRLDAGQTESFAKKKSSDEVTPTSGAVARPGALVLEGFVVEQSGATIRLVDGDGSVYAGVMEAATGASHSTDFDADGPVREVSGAESKVLADKTVALKSAASRSPASSTFRASGTNRTSGQLVVVSGRLSGAGLTNWPALRASAVTGGARAGGAVGASAVAPATAPAEPVSFFSGGVGGFATNGVGEIEGTMRVGESGWQWFRAVRSPR